MAFWRQTALFALSPRHKRTGSLEGVSGFEQMPGLSSEGISTARAKCNYGILGTGERTTLRLETIRWKHSGGFSRQERFSGEHNNF